MQEEERKTDSGLSEEDARAEALKKMQREDKRKSFCSCCAWIVAVLTVFYFFCLPSLMGARRAAYPSRAKGTLRSIGSTELAYQGENKARVYGSFQAMKDTLYIAEGYTLGTMIEKYSMTWQVNNVYTVPTEEFPSRTISTFTVIAWPRAPRFLPTFGITEDQVVRIYNPENGDDPARVKTWDPIL
jgi:hypothetical protein